VETTKIKLAKQNGLSDSNFHDQCITEYNKICPMTSKTNSVPLPTAAKLSMDILP
jgi:hypothetical protein